MYCSFFLKTMMFVFNGIIFLAGVAVLAMGIWLILDDGSLMELLGNIDHVPGGLAQLAPVSYLLIAIGRALLIIGFLGCRGAVRENRCMTMTFFTLLWIIFVAEIAAAVLAFVFKAEAADIFKDLDDTIVENFEKSPAGTLPPVWYTTMYDQRDQIPSPVLQLYPETARCTVRSFSPAIGRTPVWFVNHMRHDKIIQLLKDNAAIIGGVVAWIALIEVWKTLPYAQ
ncbi:unnamed protein product [Boreogadus saida]